MMARRYAAFAVCLLAGLVGCGPAKTYPVRGKVMVFETGPLSEGEVRFRSISNPSLIGTGKLKKDGSFSLVSAEHGEALPAGSYRAAVMAEPRKGQRLFHERFENFDTSDMQYTVTAREPPDENFFLVVVKRSGK